MKEVHPPLDAPQCCFHRWKLEKKWLLDTPYYIRDGAVDDLLDGNKANFAKMREKVRKFQDEVPK